MGNSWTIQPPETWFDEDEDDDDDDDDKWIFIRLSSFHRTLKNLSTPRQQNLMCTCVHQIIQHQVDELRKPHWFYYQF